MSWNQSVKYVFIYDICVYFCVCLYVRSYVRVCVCQIYFWPKRQKKNITKGVWSWWCFEIVDAIIRPFDRVRGVPYPELVVIQW